MYMYGYTYIYGCTAQAWALKHEDVLWRRTPRISDSPAAVCAAYGTATIENLVSVRSFQFDCELNLGSPVSVVERPHVRDCVCVCVCASVRHCAQRHCSLFSSGPIEFYADGSAAYESVGERDWAGIPGPERVMLRRLPMPRLDASFMKKRRLSKFDARMQGRNLFPCRPGA